MSLKFQIKIMTIHHQLFRSLCQQGWLTMQKLESQTKMKEQKQLKTLGLFSFITKTTGYFLQNKWLEM